MVIVFDDHAADTPAGKPFAPDTPAFDIPVAPVVECVMDVKDVLMHNVGLLEAAPAVLFAVTVIVFVAVLVLLQPPVIV
jgi:hypothetical protein